MFAGEQTARLFNSKQAAIGRGAIVVESVNPYDPVQWRVFYRNDPQFGIDRLAGQYGIYVSAVCLLTATISAPDGEPFRQRWNDLVAATDAVRTTVASEGEPIRFAQDDLAPKGWEAFAIGIGVPLFGAAILYFILGWRVAIGAPSLLSRGMSGGIAIGSILAMLGNLRGWVGGELPPEILLLLGVCGCISALGCIKGTRMTTLAAICIAATSGLELLGYAYFHWTGGQQIPYAIGTGLVACAIAGGLWWGYARTALADQA
jgi:hypothetical protein